MKKKTSKQAKIKAEKEAEQMAKIKEERSLITSEINAVFKTADMIAVDTEFKEVSLSVYQDEYDRMRRNFVSNRAEFKFQKSDKDTCTLYYSYAIISNKCGNG